MDQVVGCPGDGGDAVPTSISHILGPRVSRYYPIKHKAGRNPAVIARTNPQTTPGNASAGASYSGNRGWISVIIEYCCVTGSCFMVFIVRVQVESQNIP